MTSLSRVRGVPRIRLSRCGLLAGATGMAAVALALAFGTALADPPAPRTPPPADASAQRDLARPGEAVAKTARVAPRRMPHDAPAGRYFAIETRFLRDDGSTAMAPCVSVREGEMGSVRIGSESPFVTRLTKTSDGEAQPNIEFLEEGVGVKLKAVGDTDGLINVDATVELSRISSVGTRTVAKASRQSPRHSTQTVRAIESVQPGEKITVAVQDARPKKPSPTTLQALANVALGRRPPVEEPRLTAVEITVREVKTAPGDAAISPLIQPPATPPAPTLPAPTTLRPGK